VQLAQLEKKVYQMVVKINSVQKQLETALEENIDLKEIVKNQKETIDNFQNQENFNKLVTSIVQGNEDKVGLKKKLDQYIANIDKCITILEQKSNETKD
jgi:nitrate/nitrite-specific signal transduction histidine kinase